MLDYLIKVLLFQTLFLAVYDLFLKKETFFLWNRVYLLITSFAAYLIPFIKLDSVQTIVSQEYIIQLPEIMLSPTAVIEETFDWSVLLFDGLKWLFFIGIMVSLLLFTVKLYELIRLISKNEKLDKEKYRLVLLESSKAFSFFNYIFLGKALSEANKQQIITHELVHVRQKHSIDLLLFEVQKIVCWFNPFSYLFQRRIAELHEYIADSKAVKSTEKALYFQNILAQTFQVQKISFINPFIKISFIKKRIVMLNKNKSKQVLKFKYLLMLPLLVSMVFYSSCEKEEEVIAKDKSVKELINELKTKTDEFELSAREIAGLLDIIENLLKDEDLDDSRKKIIKEQMYLYLLKKREEILANPKIKGEVQIERHGDEYENEDIPFGTVVHSPIFPGCEDVVDPKKCFTSSLSTYVAQNFDISLAKNLGLKSGKKKIFVQFKIDKKGAIIDAKSRAPHEALEEEGIRLVESLPKMTPGKTKEGKYVNVTYMLPISFNIE